MTTQLWEIAKLVRSKNAGPFVITTDIMFEDRESFDRVRNSGAISKDLVAETYGLTPDQVTLTEHEGALAIKVSFPRKHFSGSVRDTDVFGGQFHGPLVTVEID